MKDAAIQLATLGFPVFPCQAGTKRPATAHGFHDATSDAEQIEKWWQLWPNANVAIPTERLLVLDIDPAGSDWLVNEPEKRLELTSAPTVRTPRGGLHHYFRQPNGRQLKNSAGKLAPGVDTRATGGYVLTPPSVVEGKAYSWVEALDCEPERLPLPPAWLLAMLDASDRNGVNLETLSTAGSGNGIPEGQRNSTLARLAGAMRRYGMSESEIAAALLVANEHRCKPPMDESEVRTIARSIARLAPDQITTAVVENHAGQDGLLDGIAPVEFGKIAAEYPILNEPVFDGLVRRGETLNIIAAPKVGKSWLAYDGATALCVGEPWLGFPCNPGRVLLIDNELHPATLASRIPLVAERRGIRPEEFADRLHVLALRGRWLDLFAIIRLLETISPGTYDAIILDALYRALPSGVSENDNASIAQLYNAIDVATARLNCAWLNIHHSSKGSQAEKSVTDVGAGAGAQSRAADAHLVLRPHEQDGAVVLDGVVRSFKPIQPLTLRWEFPVWMLDANLDPAKVRGRLTKQQQRQADADDEGISELRSKLAESKATARKLRESVGYGPDRCQRLLDKMFSRGEVTYDVVTIHGNKCREYQLVSAPSIAV